MSDINVVIMGLPVNEAVTENEDGSYTVFINDRLSQEGRIRAYRHAMGHIINCDFQDGDVQEIETRAHA